MGENRQISQAEEIQIIYVLTYVSILLFSEVGHHSLPLQCGLHIVASLQRGQLEMGGG